MKSKIILTSFFLLFFNFAFSSKALPDEIPGTQRGVVESINPDGISGTLRDVETGHIKDFSGATVTIDKGDGVIYIEIIAPPGQVISIIATDENGA